MRQRLGWIMVQVEKRDDWKQREHTAKRLGSRVGVIVSRLKLGSARGCFTEDVTFSLLVNTSGLVMCFCSREQTDTKLVSGKTERGLQGGEEGDKNPVLTRTPMFTALFTTAKTWKQPKCPSTDEWIKKMWYMYTVEYYSATRKNNAICSNMDGPGDHSTCSQKEKDKYHMISVICGI